MAGGDGRLERSTWNAPFDEALMSDLADQAIDRGDYAEAIRLLRAHHQESPPDLVTLGNLNLAETYDALWHLRETTERWPESDVAVRAYVRALYRAGRSREANDVIERMWSRVREVDVLRKSSLTILVAIQLGMRELALEIAAGWERPPGGEHGALTVLAHLCAEVMTRRSPRSLPVFIEVLELLRERWSPSAGVGSFVDGYTLAARTWLTIPKGDATRGSP